MNCIPLFQFFWHAEKPFKPEFIVPDTIIYRDSSIKLWLFTSKEGVVKKKLAASITKDKMREKFYSGTENAGVVATLYYESSEDVYGQIQLYKESKGVAFLSKEQFQSLLNGKINIARGVLQKFVDSGFLNNSVVECHRTKYFTSFIKRISKVQFKDSNDNFERLVTFEGPQSYSYSNLVKGQLTFSLKHFINLIEERVQLISAKKLTLRECKTYWKKDIKGKIYFLYCPSKPIQVDKIQPQPLSLRVKPERPVSRGVSRSGKLLHCAICDVPLTEDQAIDTVFRVMAGSPGSKGYSKMVRKIFRGEEINQQHKMIVCEQCFIDHTDRQQSQYSDEKEEEEEKAEEPAPQLKKPALDGFDHVKQLKGGSQSLYQNKERLTKVSNFSLPKISNGNVLKGVEPDPRQSKSLARKLDQLTRQTKDDKLYLEGELSVPRLRAKIEWMKGVLPYEGQLKLKLLEQLVASCE